MKNLSIFIFVAILSISNLFASNIFLDDDHLDTKEKNHYGILVENSNDQLINNEENSLLVSMAKPGRNTASIAQNKAISPQQKLSYALYAIEKLYVDSIKQEKLVEDAITGVLKELDPHSTYLNKEEVKEMNEPLQGNFEGIGVQFNMLNDTLFIINTVDRKSVV